MATSVKLPTRFGVVLGVMAWVCSIPASATTWVPVTRDDPILPGEHCEVSEPASWGSYIYQWPSKWDQVFWPFVDSHGLWSCAESGFVAFIGDFEGISDDERERIANYLQANPVDAEGGLALRPLLDRLEAIYALRDKEDAFRLRLLRVLAYWHENALDDPEAARRYRGRALEGIRHALEDPDLDPPRRMEYLFVAAAYSRWLGDVPASDEFILDLDVAIDAHGSGEAVDYAQYLSELARALPRITPGSRLAPKDESD